MDKNYYGKWNGNGIKGKLKEWDDVAYTEMLPAYDNGDYESAEKSASRLIEIDEDIREMIQEAEDKGKSKINKTV